MKDLWMLIPSPNLHHHSGHLLKRMTDKGLLAIKVSVGPGNITQLVKKKDYFSKHVNGLIKNFFNDSASQFASFFTQETDLSKTELEDLKELIDNEIKKK